MLPPDLSLCISLRLRAVLVLQSIVRHCWLRVAPRVWQILAAVAIAYCNARVKEADHLREELLNLALLMKCVDAERFEVTSQCHFSVLCCTLIYMTQLYADAYYSDGVETRVGRLSDGTAT